MALGKKGGLNKGLNELLGAYGKEVLEKPEHEALKEVDVARIQAGRYQPRRAFNEEMLRELAQSIAEHGILQPLVIRPIEKDRYEIIAGERRFRAAQQAGLSKVPCVVKNYNDQQALAVALIENLQRSDLNILEVAEGLQQLVDDFKLTHDRVAQLIGRSRSSITNTLRLLELSQPVKQALGEGALEMGHARALLTLTPAEQKLLLEEIKQKKLNVRQTEARVRTLQQGEPAVRRSLKDADISALEERISSYLGHAVAISHKKKGSGKVVVKYKDLEELEAIFEKWGYR